jgi:hypothetical protein
VDTEKCKALVVAYCSVQEEIRNEFVPPLTDEQLDQTMVIGNWKREGKRTDIGIAWQMH